MLDPEASQTVLAATGAKKINGTEVIQSLWSGYGKIVRVNLSGGHIESVIVKQVQTGLRGDQPRGWNTDRSHQRKLQSYEVESNWYQNWSHRLGENARVAKAFAVTSTDRGHLFVLEDLDASGFDRRFASLGRVAVGDGLTWLAHLHATFMGESPAGLWREGTYWHLATRPDEYDALSATEPLRKYAHAIDRRLRETSHPTIVHGDAKVANFCFSSKPTTLPLAAVDFQYVGGGCGMKDVAYFLGSCLSEDECLEQADGLVDHYLAELTGACRSSKRDVDTASLESEYRAMYPLAWADFHRFLLGWCPGHGKLHRYSQSMVDAAIASLDSQA